MKLLYYPHPYLDRPVTELAPINSDGLWIAREVLYRISNEMLEVMQRHNGVGLAATQVGCLHRIFVTAVPGDQVRLYVNPRIVELIGEPVEVSEGCLSFPGVETEEIRYPEVIVKAITCLDDHETWTFTKLQLVGLEAQCAQHEIEHLDGVTLASRMGRVKRDQVKRRVQKLQRAMSR